MQPTTGVFKGAGRWELFRRTWAPSGPPRAVMVLVHGLGEHGGRYGHVAAFLAERGIVVCALDQQGHGRSGGVTGSIERFSDFLDDLEVFHGKVAGEYPGLPLFLLGHSMGGLIVTAYLLEKPLAPDFVILSGPAIVPILPPEERGRIDPTRLSKDPKVWEQYLSDPLVLRERVTDRLLDRLADGLGVIVGRAGEINRPLLLIHGDADVLCSREGAQLYLEGSASPELTCQVYPGGRHEMFNETNRDEVLTAMWDWIEAHL